MKSEKRIGIGCKSFSKAMEELEDVRLKSHKEI